LNRSDKNENQNGLAGTDELGVTVKTRIVLALLFLGVSGWNTWAPGCDAAAQLYPRETTTVMWADSKTVTCRQASESQEMDAFEKELQGFLDELKRLEKEGEEKWRKEILPQLRREMERLREWLRKLKPQEETQEPIKT
jgi:hypothetical protein